MTISIIGVTSSAVADVPGTTFRALSVAPCPTDYGSQGAYRWAMPPTTFAAGLAAGSDIVQWKWTSQRSLGLLQHCAMEGFGVAAAAFTAGFGRMELYPARAWTGEGGGTAVSFTDENCKTRMVAGPQSTLGTLRYSTAGALTAGTRTIDNQPIGSIPYTLPATSVNIPILFGRQPLMNDDAGVGGMPVIAIENEGVAIRATVPATGTWYTSFSFAWSEVVTY